MIVHLHTGEVLDHRGRPARTACGLTPVVGMIVVAADAIDRSRPLSNVCASCAAIGMRAEHHRLALASPIGSDE